MSLGSRLLKVTTEVVPGSCHADVGADHALLPLYLLTNKICPKVIATEKSPSACRVAKQALWGRDADVRLGDGLEPIAEGEIQSLSICGMGGATICEILEAEPRKVPDRVIVQANKDSQKIRQWANDNGFHLMREQMVEGRWAYEILTFQRESGTDPAYESVPRDLGFYFGPLILKERHPVLIGELLRRRAAHNSHPLNVDLKMVCSALEFMGVGEADEKEMHRG